MSDPQQSDVPPHAQPSHAFPPAPPAQPQPYPPAQPQPYPPAAGQHPPAPQPLYPAAAPAASPSARGGNPLARVAFIAALITMGVTLLLTVALPVVTIGSGLSYSVVGLLSGISGLLSLLGGAVALVLGLIALRRPGSHALAGIAIGIGGSTVLGTVVGWMATLLYNVF